MNPIIVDIDEVKLEAIDENEPQENKLLEQKGNQIIYQEIKKEDKQ